MAIGILTKPLTKEPTQMTIQEMLKQYFRIEIEIEKTKHDLEETKKDRLDYENPNITSVLTDMPRGSTTSDSTANSAIKIVDILDKRIERLTFELIEMYENREFLDDTLKQLSKKHYRLIELIYDKENSISHSGHIMREGKEWAYRTYKYIITKLERMHSVRPLE